MSANFVTENYDLGNFDEWQDFVDNSTFCNIFQTRHWAKAMQEAGLKTLLIAARDRRGEIIGGMLATYGAYHFLKLRIIPSVSVRGGPLVDDLNDKKLPETIVRSFDAKSKQLGALSSFIRTFFPLDSILVKQLGYKIENDSLPCTIIHDLTKSTKQIWKELDKRARRGIRKAEKAGVIVEEANGLDDLLQYYQICVPTGIRLKIPVPSFSLFESLWRNFSDKNNFKLFLAKYRSILIGGCVALRWKDKMWAWHRASLEEYWHVNPNQLLDWHRIKWGKDSGVKMYDVLGVPCGRNKDHPKYGLYLYKKQFGGKIVRHGEYVKYYSPLRFMLLRKVLQPIFIQFSARTQGQH